MKLNKLQEVKIREFVKAAMQAGVDLQIRSSVQITIGDKELNEFCAEYTERMKELEKENV